MHRLDGAGCRGHGMIATTIGGQTMGKGRLEAFSDGVLAIIITIMVLELKVPHEPTSDALQPLLAGVPRATC